MRPMYETSETLAAERLVVESLQVAWECTLKKFPIAYQLDYMAFQDSDAKAVIEIKCRKAKYDEMFLSLHKWLAGREMSIATGLPFVLVYAFGQEIFWKPVQNEKIGIKWGGRTDRNDWQDSEPMATFKLSTFKKL